jgi:hypothetical protein
MKTLIRIGVNALTIVLVLLCGCAAEQSFIEGQPQEEIIPGVTLYKVSDALEGVLVFLVGHLPDSADAPLPPATVYWYDLQTQRTNVVWNLPRAAKVSVSMDGKWIVAVPDNVSGSEEAEAWLFSVETKRIQHLKFRVKSTAPVIVNDCIFVEIRPGRVTRSEIEVFDILTHAKKTISLIETNRPEYEEYHLMDITSVSEPDRIFFKYERWGSRVTTLTPAKGLYSYDTRSQKSERIGDILEQVPERSREGDRICWEASDMGWSLVMRTPSNGLNNSSARVVRSFNGSDAALNLTQISPCRRFAVMERSKWTSNGLKRAYLLCDLKTGACRRLLEAGPSKKTPGLFMNYLHWIGGDSQKLRK